MNTIRKAHFSLKNGFFPVFKEKNVAVEDLRVWIFLKLNFECNRTLRWHKLRYFGYLDRIESGVISFAYRNNPSSKHDLSDDDESSVQSLANIGSPKSWDNQYSLHLRLKEHVERKCIENVLKSDYCSKHIVQQMALREQIDPKSCILLSDQWKFESKKPKDPEKWEGRFKVTYFSNAEIIEYYDRNLRLRVNCEPMLNVKTLLQELAAKLKWNQVEVIQVKREKQGSIDEKMCLKEHDISVERVNNKIEEVKEKYL